MIFVFQWTVSKCMLYMYYKKKMCIVVYVIVGNVKALSNKKKKALMVEKYVNILH